MQCVLADGSPAEQGMKVTKIENCPDVWADYIESYAIVKHIDSGWVECIFPEPEMDYPLSIESKFLVPYVEPDFNETEFLSLIGGV